MDPRNRGAGGRTRTDDLLITNQLLYQLSYAGRLVGSAAHFDRGQNRQCTTTGEMRPTATRRAVVIVEARTVTVTERGGQQTCEQELREGRRRGGSTARFRRWSRTRATRAASGRACYLMNAIVSGYFHTTPSFALMAPIIGKTIVITQRASSNGMPTNTKSSRNVTTQ